MGNGFIIQRGVTGIEAGNRTKRRRKEEKSDGRIVDFEIGIGEASKNNNHPKTNIKF
jgi:hypothetical protein